MWVQAVSLRCLSLLDDDKRQSEHSHAVRPTCQQCAGSVVCVSNVSPETLSFQYLALVLLTVDMLMGGHGHGRHLEIGLTLKSVFYTRKLNRCLNVTSTELKSY